MVVAHLGKPATKKAGKQYMCLVPEVSTCCKNCPACTVSLNFGIINDNHASASVDLKVSDKNLTSRDF